MKTELRIVAQAVRDTISKYKIGRKFSGTELKNDVVRICPIAKYKYVDTILRRMRAIKKNGKRTCICIDHDASIYQKIA